MLASFLLTEVIAYPAFCWALLALTHAVERKQWTTDLLALAAIGVAVLARTQFIVLLGVLLVAVAAEAMLEATPRGAPANLWRTRRHLVYLFGGLLLVVLAAVVIGKGSKLLGSYSVTAENVRIDLDLFRLAFEHLALLALGLAILPFIVGVGWLVDRVRPSARPAERRVRRRRLHDARAGHAPGRLVQPALRRGPRQGSLPLLRRARRARSASRPRS